MWGNIQSTVIFSTVQVEIFLVHNLFVLLLFRVTKFLLWQAAEPSDRKSHEKAPDMTEKRMPGVQVLN